MKRMHDSAGLRKLRLPGFFFIGAIFLSGGCFGVPSGIPPEGAIVPPEGRVKSRTFPQATVRMSTSLSGFWLRQCEPEAVLYRDFDRASAGFAEHVTRDLASLVLLRGEKVANRILPCYTLRSRLTRAAGLYRWTMRLENASGRLLWRGEIPVDDRLPELKPGV